MTNIQITINSAQVEALLSNIANNASHLQPAMNAIAHDITENIRLTLTQLVIAQGVLNPWYIVGFMSMGGICGRCVNNALASRY
ncbi:hypothetical protein BCS42_04845 [Crenothrix sp. D3]|nr:hypothetical protein BCS42_04845 [Crenothrix sp. D3]